MSRAVTTLLVALAFAGSPGLTAAAESAPASTAGFSATLDGEIADLATATKYHCHDLTPGILTCFRSADARDFDAEAATSTQGSAVELAGSGNYVIAWDYLGFAGSSVFLSQDYPYLSSLGWNDKISSYKAYMTRTGYFFQHAQYAGGVQAFCCNAEVTNVGATFNNAFSSLNLP